MAQPQAALPLSLHPKDLRNAFENQNKKVAIKNIKFYLNDSTEIKLKNITTVRKNDKSIKDIKFKDLDYSSFPKSFAIKNSGKVFGFSRGRFSDTIYLGDITSQRKLSISKLIFSDKLFKSQRLSTSFINKKNKLSIPFCMNLNTDFSDDYFVDIKSLESSVVEDIRYATTNNFTSKVIYECPRCLMRYGAAKDFVKAAREFLTMGYRIKVFDCYRPHSAQYKLWEIMPNKNYVANPDKGSIHNRGAAVDMTLVDSLGYELDMGTGFDYFGLKAYSIFFDLPEEVIKNRRLMWSVMNKHGFKEIKTEWWHLSHYSCLKYPISDEPFRCN